MNILAIDLGEKTGYCSAGESGQWDLKPKISESTAIRYHKFKMQLVEAIREMEIGLVAYEIPAGRHVQGQRPLYHYEGVLLAVCNELGLDYIGYRASQIKKHATGSGSANKDNMYRAAVRKLGYTGSKRNDNEIDAIWIYDLAHYQFTNSRLLGEDITDIINNR